MVCNECGKKFRSIRQAEVHAERTYVLSSHKDGFELIMLRSEHTKFEESTEEIAPLTEEEKKQKLEELRANLAEKRAKQAIIDKEEAKKNEVHSLPPPPTLLHMCTPPLPLAKLSPLPQKIRMKSTKEVADLKEQLAHKELQKAAAAKKAEKAADAAAKKRIQDKIAADKEARRLKAEEAKALREGRAPSEASITTSSPPAPASSASKPAANHTEARLRLQTAGGTLTKTFTAETTLLEVAMSVQAENGGAEVKSLTMTFPKKTWEGNVDFGLTVKEAGLMPSAVLIVK